MIRKKYLIDYNNGETKQIVEVSGKSIDDCENKVFNWFDNKEIHSALIYGPYNPELTSIKEIA